jgi:hypothetical protein
MVADPDAYLEKKVAIDSFYFDGSRVTYSAAKIEDVHPSGAIGRWILCGPAPNPSRSGSPVIDADGTVVAIFVERASGEQDRFRVIPLSNVQDIAWSRLRPSGAPTAVGSAVDSITYSFQLQLGTNDDHPPISQGRDRFLFYPDGHRVDASDMSLLQLGLAAAGGAMVRYPIVRTQTYQAFPGYHFTAEVKVDATSHNPNEEPLPDRLCSGDADPNCFQISQNGKLLTVRTRLFAGPDVDRARGWLDGYVTVRMAKDL